METAEDAGPAVDEPGLPDGSPADESAADGSPADGSPADESPADESPADESVGPGPTTAATTGHPAVDEVLRSLEGLDGRPVDEHVAAFEDAHEQLRRALSGAGDDQD